MISWSYNADSGRFEITSVGIPTDDEIQTNVKEILSDEHFGPGSKVLVDNTRQEKALTVSQIMQYLRILNQNKKKIARCRYAVIVSNSGGLMMTNVISSFSGIVNSRVRGFTTREAAESWLESEA